MSVLLRTEGLTKDFAGFRAVDAVDLAVQDQSIHSIIGPNGAGKSTLFALLSGYASPTTGRVLLGGVDVTNSPARVMARRGVVCSFQISQIFRRLSVLECAEAAVVARGGECYSFWRGVGHSTVKRAAELLDSVGLSDVGQERAGNLSHGDQRILEVALALAAEPRLLLLDEPTAGMSPAETDRTVELLRKLSRERDLTILLVEHDVEVVFSVSDQVTVLHQGAVLREGSPQQIRGDAAVREIYLGEESDA